MKYYSEILRKFYPTENECAKAEAEYSAAQKAKEAREAKLAADRKIRAKEVEDAFKRFIEARKKYDKLLEKFVNDYGSFHMTYSDTNTSTSNPIKDAGVSSFNDLARMLRDLFD